MIVMGFHNCHKIGNNNEKRKRNHKRNWSIAKSETAHASHYECRAVSRVRRSWCYRSYFSRIFYFYLDFYWRSTVVLFAVSCDCTKQLVEHAIISDDFHESTAILYGSQMLMENYDVARENCKERGEKSTEYINWICHRCSQSVKNELETVRMDDAWITRKQWGATKNREKFFASFLFICGWPVDYEWLDDCLRISIRFYDLNCETCLADADAIIITMITYDLWQLRAWPLASIHDSPQHWKCGDHEIDSAHFFFCLSFVAIICVAEK